MLAEVARLETERAQLSAELDRRRECDPEVLEKLKADSRTAKQAVNRWTGMYCFRKLFRAR